MIGIQVSHSKHPADATAQAANRLNEAGVHHSVDGDTISFVDQIEFNRGFPVLKSAGFEVRTFPDPPEAKYR
jgi:hypothetical protein